MDSSYLQYYAARQSAHASGASCCPLPCRHFMSALLSISATVFHGDGMVFS